MKTIACIRAGLLLGLTTWLSPTRAEGTPALALWRGTDFRGGAQGHFGANLCGREGVNYVYAQPTGAAATMTAVFDLPEHRRRPLYLYLEAMDDDAPAPCHIEVRLNQHVVWAGPSGFPNAQWRWHRYLLPTGAAHPGTNALTILNQEPRGSLGMPPWFMVARAAVATAGYQPPAAVVPTLQVRLPARLRPLPEPLPPGHTEPGFKYRGTKGWGWTPAQYLAEIPVLASLNMNFLMNCYSSMFTDPTPGRWKNEWWKPLPETKKAAYTPVFQACREHGLIFCFALHPQLGSPRPLDPTRPADVDALYQNYAWAQSQGVRWFSVSLDDVSWSRHGPAEGGAEHAHLVNTILGRLRQQDPQAQMIFCPGPYWGDGTAPTARPYLAALGQELDPGVYVFWTGDGVVTPRITRRAAESYRRIVRHRLFLWDNYPVNDANPTLHLGPVRGRERDLGEVIDGYMSNPMATQNEINRIPLATCADYAYNPLGYDPARSIGQALLRQASSGAERRVLRDLVQAYPGFLVTGGGTGTNPQRQRFADSLAGGHSDAARATLRRLRNLATRMARAFPQRFEAAQQTLAGDITWMEQQLPPPR